ncbi:MAG: prepilin-type N-terminal cleavage/methylation domain-containing protein [Thiobacillus sp.]|nr:prepilin-type N-terminal cleavage/methylation domain-containing protein [Thiobacillus sp.]
MIKTARGFTLIEMAIVLVIITILIGGLAMPLSAQIQARRIAETRKTLNEAREAIMGYAMRTSIASTCNCTYSGGTLFPSAPTTCAVSQCPATGTSTLTLPVTRHHLPCPDSTGDGREDRNLATQKCALSSGWLAWVDLGTASQDAWGNRLLYAVNQEDASNPSFADKTTGFSSSTPLPNPLQVCNTNTCPIPYNSLTAPNPYVALNVVFVVASLGANGWGALNVNGNSLAAPTGANELENQDGDQAYVIRTPTPVGGVGGEFDDLIEWVSLPQLTARLCPTGSGCSP